MFSCWTAPIFLTENSIVYTCKLWFLGIFAPKNRTIF